MGGLDAAETAPTRWNTPHNGPPAAESVRFPTPPAHRHVDSGAPHPGLALIPGSRAGRSIDAHHCIVNISDSATCPQLTPLGELYLSRDEAMQS